MWNSNQFMTVFASGAFFLLVSSSSLASSPESEGVRDTALPVDADKKEQEESGVRNKMPITFPVGLEFPSGRIGTGGAGKAKDILGGRTYIGLDMGYRTSPHVLLSLRPTLYLGKLGGAFETMCDAGRRDRENKNLAEGKKDENNETCFQAGGALSFHVRYDMTEELPTGGLSPWISYGVGAEGIHLFGYAYTNEYLGSFESNLYAANLAIVDLGVDWRANSNLVLGVFAHAKVGTYFERTGTFEVLRESYEVDYGRPGFHHWIGGGLSMTYL